MVIPLAGAFLVWLMSAAVVLRDRKVLIGLFSWALFFRLLVVLTLIVIDGGYAAGDLLSPDGKAYLRGSRALADSHFLVGPPVAYFGSYDVGHYYIFGLVSAFLGSQVVQLEILTATLGALTAPVVFAWARSVIPTHAIAIALVAAFSPALVLFSTSNLLKDPIVVLLTATLLWALAAGLRTASDRTYLFWFALAATALAVLHVTRFYVAVYLEVGLIAALVPFLLRRPSGRTRVALGLLGTILVSEIVPTAFGWPPPSAMLVAQIAHVNSTPAMQNDPGPIEEVLFGPGTPEWLAAAARPAIGPARRVFGPFIWVPPARWDLRYLLSADFDLYADTFLWYLLLPSIVVGLVIAVRLLLMDPPRQLELGALAIFVAIYLAQYLVINLSYRQREDVLPFALAFAPAGIGWLGSASHGRLIYGTYWSCIGLMVVAQVLLKNFGK